MFSFSVSQYRLHVLIVCLMVAAGCKPRVETPTEVVATPDRQNISIPPINVDQSDWPWWRGFGRNNRTNAEAGKLPDRLTDASRQLWTADIPGKGRSTPIIVKDVAYLTSGVESENQAQTVLAFDTNSGAKLWETIVHTQGFDPKSHEENSQASPTMATDGERLYAVFMSHGKVQVTALSFDGDILWTKPLGQFHSMFGFGPSPLVFGNAVYVAVDHDQGGFLCAIRRDTGDVLWLKQRPARTNFATPVVAQINGLPQILITGDHHLMSYDASTGEFLWKVPALAETMVGMPIILAGQDGNARVYLCSGGYPESETIAFDLTQSPPARLWSNKEKLYVPSLSISDDEQTLYGMDDEGIAMAWSVDKGKTLWKKRLGGPHSASGLLVGDRYLTASEKGDIKLLQVTPEKADVLSEEKLGDEIYATPLLVKGKIYIRTAFRNDGDYQEKLICIKAD